MGKLRNMIAKRNEEVNKLTELLENRDKLFESHLKRVKADCQKEVNLQKQSFDY